MFFRKVLLNSIIVVLLFSLCFVIAEESTCRFKKVKDKELRLYISSLVIPYMEKIPNIDGALEKDEWKGAESTDEFLMLGTNKKAGPFTRAWLGVDKENFYAAFRCSLFPGIKPRTKAKGHDGNLWADDSIEFFIWPDFLNPIYYHFSANSAGVRFEQKRIFDNITGERVSSRVNWDIKWIAKAKYEKDAWTLEIAIPLSELGIKPEGIKAVRFNICRNIVPGKTRFSTWSFLPEPEFHAPQNFGIGICTFGIPRNRDFNISEMTGLGGCGLMRLKPKNKNLTLRKKHEIIVRAALPKRLFDDFIVILEPRVIPVLSGRKAESISLGEFKLRTSDPVKLSIKNIGSFSDSSIVNILVKVKDANTGTKIFELREDISFIGNEIPGKILSRFRTVNFAKMSQTEPFKAVGYLGAAVSFERLKREMESSKNVPLIFNLISEVTNRLTLIETGKLPEDVSGLQDLLTLTAQPEAQVVVEYYPDAVKPQAFVSFSWGAFPLASAEVEEFPSEEKARESLIDLKGGLKALSEKATILGLPARIAFKRYSFKPFLSSLFKPDQHILMYNPLESRSSIVVLDVENIGWTQPEAIVLFEPLSYTLRDKIKSWAKDNNIPIIKWEKALYKKRVLIAGDFRKDYVFSKKIRYSRFIYVKDIVPSGTRLRVVSGKRTIYMWRAPSQEIAEYVVKLILDGKAVQLKDVDTLRRMIVKKIKASGNVPALPKDMRLFFGDTHMHTFYSDGKLSPVGLALQTLYAGMDFAVITDHNTLEGAKLSQKLLSRYGLLHSVIVGEEITTSWAHLNAYPLKHLIPWKKLSPYETIKKAHKQGAVIQWNHPGYKQGAWSKKYLAEGISGTGLDAWEHIPWEYDEWEKQGKLPLLVGASDTHSGIFGYGERTVILAPSPKGDDVAEAIRRGKAVLLEPHSLKILYGPKEMISLVAEALSEGKSLKRDKTERLKKALKNLYLIGLIKASPSKPEFKESK
jgi:hypothetical protein